MFNFIGNLSSIATPIIFRLLVTEIDFSPDFVYMAAITMLCVLSYIFFVGRVLRVEETVGLISRWRNVISTLSRSRGYKINRSIL